jgi:hypothetical protein
MAVNASGGLVERVYVDILLDAGYQFRDLEKPTMACISSYCCVGSPR